MLYEVITVNRQMERMFGYSGAEMNELRISDITYESYNFV